MITTTRKILKEKLTKLYALSEVLEGSVIIEDIQGLISKYENCLDDVRNADIDDDETIFIHESNSLAAISNKGTQNTVQFRGCTIKKGHRYGTFLIVSGKISTTLTPSTPQGTRNIHKNLFSKGYVDNDGNILKEIEGSASFLATIISGSNMNGRPIVEPIKW